jgi:hypothetical protein
MAEGSSAFSRKGLEAVGFGGFMPVSQLASGESRRAIPATSGVYVVFRESATRPRFRSLSPAGWFKGRDPSLPADILRRKWVAGANVVYIGMSGEGARAGLRNRIRSLVRFGTGHATGHAGGRALWHLPDSDDLLIAWRETHGARAEEQRLLNRFREEYGSLPFGNADGRVALLTRAD